MTAWRENKSLIAQKNCFKAVTRRWVKEGWEREGVKHMKLEWEKLILNIYESVTFCWFFTQPFNKQLSRHFLFLSQRDIKRQNKGLTSFWIAENQGNGELFVYSDQYYLVNIVVKVLNCHPEQQRRKRWHWPHPGADRDGEPEAACRGGWEKGHGRHGSGGDPQVTPSILNETRGGSSKDRKMCFLLLFFYDRTVLFG